MAVDPPKDREAYEKGVEDSKRGVLSEILNGPEDVLWRMQRSESEEAAYVKGRSGDQLDADKDK